MKRMVLSYFVICCLSAVQLVKSSEELTITQSELESNRLSSERIKAHVTTLASYGSRVPGYSGHAKARNYVLEQLLSYGFVDGYSSLDARMFKTLEEEHLRIGTHRFNVTTPVERPGSKLTLKNQPTSLEHELPLNAVWPNGAALTHTGRTGVSGKLLAYISPDRQQLRERVFEHGPTFVSGLDHLPVDGSIVLIDLDDHEANWLTVAGMGAQAVIFIEPTRATQNLLKRLNTSSPIEFPRMWLARAQGLKLREAVLEAQKSGQFIEATAHCAMDWQTTLCENIYVYLKGSSQEQDLKKRRVSILTAHYDSNSMVPALAPGAEQAISCAALLELASSFASAPPEHDTLLVFFAAHYQSLTSEREFFLELARDLKKKTLLPDIATSDLALKCAEATVGLEIFKLIQAGIQTDPQGTLQRTYLDQAATTAVDKHKEASEALSALAKSKDLDTGELDPKTIAIGVLLLVLGLLWTFLRNPLVDGLIAWILLICGLILLLVDPILSIRYIKELKVEPVINIAPGYGVPMIAMALVWFIWRERARIQNCTAILMTACTILLYVALLPWLRPLLKSSSYDGGREWLNTVLDVWKEETALMEAEFERQTRLLHFDLEPLRKNTDSTDAQLLETLERQYEQKREQRRQFELSGRKLYTLTPSGQSAKVPSLDEPIIAALQTTLQESIERMSSLLRWCQDELDRRAWNESFAAMFQALCNEKDKRPIFHMGLDLSAGYPGLALFFKGKLYNQPGDIEASYKKVGRVITPLCSAIEKTMGVDEGVLLPDTLVSSKRGWSTYLGAELAISSEVAFQAGLRSLTFAPPYDQRLFFDSPHDDLRPDGALAGNWDHLDTQLKMLGTLIRRLPALPRLPDENRITQKDAGYAMAVFKTVRRGGAHSIFPNIPLRDALVLECEGDSGLGDGSACGVRLTACAMTSPLGLASIAGLRAGERYSYEIYKSDPVNGEITFAINKPKSGLNENTSLSVSNRDRRIYTVETLRAQGLALLGIVDPGRLKPLRNCSLLAAKTESKPLEYGTSHAYKNEPHRVLFGEPNSLIKCLFREGEFGLRMAILNVRPETVELLLDPAHGKADRDESRGVGFRLGTRKVLDWLPLRTATDLWCLAEYRLGDLRAKSIGNAKLDNPNYPGRYSQGTVSIERHSDVLRGTGVNWDHGVLNLPFQALGNPYIYRVVERIDAQTLKLDRKFESPSLRNSRFVLSKETPGLHNLTQYSIMEAREAKAAGQYGMAWTLGTQGWGLESRAYPEVLGTANDSVVGVVFYLFLLLPFCFFLERLLFAFTKIEHQLLAFFSIFILMFSLLWMVHPAFDLVASPPVILLAFIIMCLAGIVIAIVYSKFDSEMQAIQRGIKGVQAADVNRASAAMVAVSLGISQMRRRKLRTFLTCATVVLLTFTALSFTSVVQTLSNASIDLSPGDEKDAPYNGILVRQINYMPLEQEIYTLVRSELNAYGHVCVPRYWKAAKATTSNNQRVYTPVYIDIRTEKEVGGRAASPSSMLGLSHLERELFPQLTQGIVKAGEWLTNDDDEVCIVPANLARRLFGPENADQPWDVEDAVGKEIYIGSLSLKIQGVFDSERFGQLKDQDGEPLTPVNFYTSDSMSSLDQQKQDEASVDDLEGATNVQFDHYTPEDMIIIPYRLADRIGGMTLHAIAGRIDNPRELNYHVSQILQRLQKNIFVGEEGRRKLYASSGRTSLTGLANLLVPLLISVLILLNTMVGAVYERSREITIFSALGLAPTHIAALFLAEALVYATLGAIFGYLFGQGTALFVTYFGEALGIGGLYLNYSSSSAVFVTFIVMLSVLLSTLYPSRMAARAAAPSEDRRWSIPQPKGDEIALELPFSFQRDLVPGVALFLYEWLEQHSESSLGSFTARETTMETFTTEKGRGLCLYFMAWLAPYDLGVSQEVQLYIVPTADELYVTEASFYRVSGYLNSWQRLNLPFLNALRKHLLIWRTYSAEQRLEFSVRGFAKFSEVFEAVGWPPPEGYEEVLARLQSDEAAESARQQAAITTKE